jgi:hypothetical protein
MLPLFFYLLKVILVSGILTGYYWISLRNNKVIKPIIVISLKVKAKTKIKIIPNINNVSSNKTLLLKF